MINKMFSYCNEVFIRFLSLLVYLIYNYLPQVFLKFFFLLLVLHQELHIDLEEQVLFHLLTYQLLQAPIF